MKKKRRIRKKDGTGDWSRGMRRLDFGVPALSVPFCAVSLGGLCSLLLFILE